MSIIEPKPKIAESHKPQSYNLNGQLYLTVPILNKDEKGKINSVDYVIEFPVGNHGPSWQYKVIYRAPGLGEPSRADIHHARDQVYAVWKNIRKKVEATP